VVPSTGASHHRCAVSPPRHVRARPRAMLGRLVKQFVKRGARDHLGGARRVQETTDLHRLFVLTAFHRTEGDGPELVSQVLAIGKDLQFDELKAEVCGNLTEQAHRVCAAVRDALAAGRAASPSSQSDAFTKGVLDRIGFACRVAPSGAGPGSGDGLFVRGEVNPGEIVAFYPGLVYDLENVRHIPGYPKVSDGNEYLIARYDGSVVDANPWGSGGDLVAVDSECLSLLARRNGVTFDASRDSNRGQNEHFGRWPGPPLSPRRLDEEESETSEKKLKQEKRAGVGGFLDHTLTPPLCSLLRTTATAEALNLTRNNPLALAHFANHPPVGYHPNVVVAGVDLVRPDGAFPNPTATVSSLTRL
jgi:hypothetical protein